MTKALLLKCVAVVLLTSSPWLAQAQSSWRVGLSGGVNFYPTYQIFHDAVDAASKTVRSNGLYHYPTARPTFGLVAERGFRAFFVTLGFFSSQQEIEGSILSSSYIFDQPRVPYEYQTIRLLLSNTSVIGSFGYKLGNGWLRLRTSIGLGIEFKSGLKIDSDTGYSYFFQASTGLGIRGVIKPRPISENDIQIRVAQVSPTFLFRIGPEIRFKRFMIAFEQSVLYRMRFLEEYEAPSQGQSLTYFQAQATVYYTLFSKPKE